MCIHLTFTQKKKKKKCWDASEQCSVTQTKGNDKKKNVDVGEVRWGGIGVGVGKKKSLYTANGNRNE